MASKNEALLTFPMNAPCRADAFLSVLLGSLLQAFSRQKTVELSHLRQIEARAVWSSPVLLRLPPIGSQGSSRRPELRLSTLPCVNILRFQAVKPKSGNHARPQENIVIFSCRPLPVKQRIGQWRQFFLKMKFLRPFLI